MMLPIVRVAFIRCGFVRRLYFRLLLLAGMLIPGCGFGIDGAGGLSEDIRESKKEDFFVHGYKISSVDQNEFFAASDIDEIWIEHSWMYSGWLGRKEKREGYSLCIKFKNSVASDEGFFSIWHLRPLADARPLTPYYPPRIHTYYPMLPPDSLTFDIVRDPYGPGEQSVGYLILVVMKERVSCSG